MQFNKLADFDELQELYENGLYTDVEFLSKTIELMELGDDALWEYLPSEVKKKLLAKIASFSEEDELVSFSGGASSEDTKKELLELKAWLIKKGAI